MVATTLLARSFAAIVMASLGIIAGAVLSGLIWPSLVDQFGERAFPWIVSATIVVVASIPAALLHISRSSQTASASASKWRAEIYLWGPWAALRYFWQLKR